MKKSEIKQVEDAIDNLIDGDTGDFDFAIKILCKLVGRNINKDTRKNVQYLDIKKLVKSEFKAPKKIK